MILVKLCTSNSPSACLPPDSAIPDVSRLTGHDPRWDWESSQPASTVNNAA